MNKTGHLAAAIFLMFVFFAGCSFAPNPKEVLSEYLDNYSKGNYSKACRTNNENLSGRQYGSEVL